MVTLLFRERNLLTATEKKMFFVIKATSKFDFFDSAMHI